MQFGFKLCIVFGHLGTYGIIMDMKDIHVDSSRNRGARSLEIKTNNLKKLHEVVPDIVAAEKISGSTWRRVIEEGQWPLEAQVAVVHEVVRQSRHIYETYGILIRDRNADNILLEPTKEKTAIHIGNQRYRVRHIDTEFVYDVVEDATYIKEGVDLRTRIGRVRVKNQQTTTAALSDTCGSIVDAVSQLMKRYQRPNPLAMLPRPFTFEAIQSALHMLK